MSQDRAFLGLSTLRDLIIKKPQGLNDFLDALLEVTMNDLELVIEILWYYIETTPPH